MPAADSGRPPQADPVGTACSLCKPQSCAGGADTWRFAVEGSGLGMWEWRPLQGPPCFSLRCMEMLGYHHTPAMASAVDWLSLIHEEDRARARAELVAALKGERESYTSEYQVLCADGIWKWVLVRGAVMARDPGGRALQVVGTMADVSEKHAHIAALKRAEEASRTAFEDLSSYLKAIDQHALVSVTDSSGRILEVNDKFCQVSGYSRQELLGSNHRILNSGHHRPGFFQAMWSTISQGQIWRGEICNRAKAGSLYWVDSAIVPQLDRAGRPARYFSVRVEITERKANEQRIRYLARHDALTGLPNRTLLEDRLQHTMARARRRNGQFAVLFIDLDRFKDVNDTEGHEAGDKLLQQVAQRLKALLRAEDTLSRQGGDEFIVLISELAQGRDAAAVATKLLEAIAQPFDLGRKTVHIAASIGIAVYPQDGEDAETLFRHSDIAMYQVKESGRHAYRFFTAGMQQRVNERQQWRELLHQALERQAVQIRLVPICSAQSGALEAMEVLADWEHAPDKDGDNDFLARAEEVGMAGEVSAWMVDQACALLARWQGRQGQAMQEGQPPPRLIVNVTSIVAQQPQFLETVVQALTRHAVAPRLLGIGLKEWSAATPAVQEALTALGNTGIGIYLMGFGTGSCSIPSLQALHLSGARIDRSLVAGAGQRPQLLAVVKAMCDLLHALGVPVIADGVEDEAQKLRLIALGCDSLQGSWLHPSRSPSLQGEWK